MTYSCTDFTDDIIGALDVTIPDSADDSPSDQADICMAEIGRLQSSEKAFAAALGAFVVMPDEAERPADAMTGMRISFAELRQVKAALAGVPVLPAPQIFVAIFETRHGDETRAYHSLDTARAWRREVAAENWASRMPDDEVRPADAQEAADVYFERVGEMRGDFFRIEELEIAGPVAPSPGVDWRAIAQELAGALGSTVQQIEQMEGMFDDGDGTIAASLKDAKAASACYRAALKIGPAASAPAARQVWTLTTDGDNMGIGTSVYTCEADALNAACEVLRIGYKAKPMPDNLDTLDAEAISDLWAESFDGACIIESHDLPA
ncbi:hypothetical protein IVB09_41275 [Bradyrhizobium sp. 174]|nr:hypothetical protein [Bradyrhizobium sp. 174]